MPRVSAVADLGADRVREALRLLGAGETRGGRRELAGLLRGYGTVHTALDSAPPGARAAFVRLVEQGPAPVQELLGRGWWGRGSLPPPLDWLQHRALVAAGDDGLVHAVTEAAEGYAELTLPLDRPGPTGSGDVRVEEAACVVVVDDPAALDAALGAPGADLRAVAPTVAVSTRAPTTVRAALRAARVPLVDDAAVAARPREPALPGTAEDAVGPGAVRALLTRAVDEGRQLQLEYYASSRGGAATERTVDPWTFDGSLLRGYCHLRAGERTFALDRIGRARLLASGLQVPAEG